MGSLGNGTVRRFGSKVAPKHPLPARLRPNYSSRIIRFPGVRSDEYSIRRRTMADSPSERTRDNGRLPGTRLAAVILFYDGHCGLCHSAVKFVLKHDRRALFRFAPLQGELAKQHLPPSLPGTMVVGTGDGYPVDAIFCMDVSWRDSRATGNSLRKPWLGFPVPFAIWAIE